MPVEQFPGVLSFEDTRRAVEQQASQVRHLKTESVYLLAASGRVLAESILADRNLPPFPRSTRDGYAVRAADVALVPATLDVIREVRAGESLENIPKLIGSGQAASIMTGAPVPSGADAVVMVEYTAQQGNRVEIQISAARGENIVPSGAEAKQASVLVERGVCLNDAAIALAASAGKSRVQV